jgi:hypothetical protein
MVFVKNGGSYLNGRIRGILADPSSPRTLTISGNYEIEETILLPSDFTLLLEDCHLRMAPKAFCNLFRNQNAGISGAAHPDRNIRILGRGRAILDGGEYNGLSENNSEKDGMPHISVNNLILLANVDGFAVEGLHLLNQRWWAVNLLWCRRGVLRDVDFCADDRQVEPDGGLAPYLSHRENGYAACHIHNADGIDLRCGCHDILIDHVTGFTQDDTVALTGLPGRLESLFRPTPENGGEVSDDIYNVTIRNVCCEAFCANIRLLNQGGVKLYNIIIDGMMDSSKGSPHMDRGICGVRIGGNHLYGSRHSTCEETGRITVRNVFSRAGCALRLAGCISELRVENIFGFDGCETLIENDARLMNALGI